MAKIISTKGVPVRFHFTAEIDFIVPRTPQRQPDEHISDDTWIKRFASGLESEVTDCLNRENFDCVLRSYRSLHEDCCVYRAQFSVSSDLHYFIDRNFSREILNLQTAKIKYTAFLRRKMEIELFLWSILEEIPVAEISYDYHASRTFVFFVYLVGYLEIRHVFGPEDIKYHGGSVRETISSFNEDVVKRLEDLGWCAEPKPDPVTRRPPNNIYKFDLNGTIQMRFAENEVDGAMAMLKASSNSLDEDDGPELDFSDDVCEIYIEDQRRAITDELGDLDVVSFGINYTDYDDNYSVENTLS